MLSSPALQTSPADSDAGPHVRFRELFEQCPVSLQILGPDGRTLRVNQAWEDLWEIRAGTSLMAFVMSADYNVLRDSQLIQSGIALLLERAFQGESVRIPVGRYDVAALGGSGPVRWVAARAHPIKDNGGNIVEVMLMHEDVTEKMEAENALRIREERFRSLVTATSQIVWSNTPDGRVDEDSPSWRAFTGQTYEEWRGFGWLDAVHPDDRDTTKAAWLACVAAKTLFEARYRLRRADGDYRWTEVRGVPILDAEGAIREWIGTNTDIHESVLAEAELAQRLEREKRNAALLAKVAQAARKLQTVLWSGDIAEVLVNEVRDILQAHHAVVSLSNNHAEVCRTDQAMRGRLAVPLIDRTGMNIGLIQVSGKKEGEFSDEDEAILVQLASIAANGFENARLYQSLQEQDRRKDEFLAMLAHELRNPLAPISAAAEVLKLGTASDDRIRQSSSVIGRQVRHLKSLIDDLLDVSRVTRGLIQLDLALLDPMALVASAVEQSQPLIGARAHVLAVEGDAGGAQIRGDANRLVQVLVNLLNNAAKYTPEGGRIALTVSRDADRVIISVRDNGTGIEAGMLPHIFDLFTQAKRTPDRAQGGLGIGLALVKTIISLHDGRVTAHSDGLGAGSVFTIALNAVGPT
ncbi:PAS domain S-box protein [Telluria mixta]|uniref:histidine kinase n=1 Tax=Telluria mixta TaxID=34071 RepID=A0ABT2BSN5_9BURK|nr:ATP-binding protein [Telluria mixta]MCS0628007.1 PAS domain S-box protein [Telluria mixta]WEM93875.1 PAS domain S-box protein [Telluria mixta]